MAENRIVLRRTGGKNEPKLGRMLVISMVVHLFLLGIAGKGLQFRFAAPERPVYYVDLREPPKKVAAPAPRPPTATEPRPVESAKPIPVKADPPKPRVVTPPPPKTSPPKGVVKPKGSPPVAIVESGLAELEAAIQGIQKSQQQPASTSSPNEEYERIKAELAAMTSAETSAAPAATSGVSGSSGAAPGAEPGVDERTWIEAFLKEKWRFSQYQIEARNRESVECALWVIYGAEGALREYRFDATSGNEQFDTSVKAAVLKGKQLPFTPGRELRFRVVFNLKDMTE